MFSFQTFPQRPPEGWGLFLSLAVSGGGAIRGVDAAPPRGAASERSLLCCGSGSGPGIPGPFACAYRCRDRPPGVDAPARWAHSAGAGFDPTGPANFTMAGCPLCGRLFPPPPRPAVWPAPSWCEVLQIAAPPSPASSRLSASGQELAEESPNGKVRFRCSGRHHHHLGHHGRSIVALSARTADDGRHRACKLVDRSCSASHVVIAGAVLIP